MCAGVWERRRKETVEFRTWGRSHASASWAAYTVWRELEYGYGTTA